MLYKVIKLLLKTRFSPSFFVMIFLLIFYSFISLSDGGQRNISLIGGLYFGFIITVFVTISIILGGVSVTKSDQEFLLVSPIKRTDLVISLFLAQFIASGLLMLAAALVAIVELYKGSPLLVVAVVDVFLLTLFSVSSGIALSEKPIYLRIPLAAASILWILSPYLGFRYGAISFLTVNPFYSLITVLPVTILSMSGAAFILSGENLPFRVSGLRRQSRDFRKTSSYTGLSPSRAILKMGITQVSIASRSSSLGNIRATARRIEFTTFLYAFIIAAVIYTVIVLRYGSSATYVPVYSGFGFNIYALVLVLYGGSAPQMMMSSGAMAYERAWLSLTSMEPGKYLNTLIISKMLQAAIAGLPFSIANLLLFSLGIKGTLGAVPVFEIVSPFTVAVYLFMAFSIRPYQMKDENYIPARLSVTQFMMVLPLFMFYGISFLTMFYIPSLIVTVPFMAIIIALILTRSKYWEKRLNKMVEAGFI